MIRTRQKGLLNCMLVEKKLVEWTIKTCDALFVHNVRPAIGSVVYCNLGMLAEHSGIYVGNNKIVHLNGDGRVEKVSTKKFCERFSGLNPSFTVLCPTDSHGKAFGDRKVADYALNSVGKVMEYHPFIHNCHCFTASCLSNQVRLCPSFAILEQLIIEKYPTFPKYHTSFTTLKA